jgi:hypothetical protein
MGAAVLLVLSKGRNISKAVAVQVTLRQTKARHAPSPKCILLLIAETALANRAQ